MLSEKHLNIISTCVNLCQTDTNPSLITLRKKSDFSLLDTPQIQIELFLYCSKYCKCKQMFSKKAIYILSFSKMSRRYKQKIYTTLVT